MTSLLPTILFAATAAAQVTTSFWMPRFALPAEHIGWAGSVVNANETHTTIVADYDNGTDTSALSLGGGPLTMTVGPTVFGIDISLPGGFSRDDDDDDDSSYNYFCNWPTPDEVGSNRTCTASFPAGLVGQFVCGGTVYASMSAETFTYTHTYPARGSDPAGTETVEYTFSQPYGSETLPHTNKPAVCSGLSSGQEAEEAYSTAAPYPASSIETYYLVLTAGTEKLEATQAATPTISSATSTGTGSADASSASSGSAAMPEATAAGASMVTGVPMLAGLGAVAALLV